MLDQPSAHIEHICVKPSYLVSESYEDGQEKDEALPVVDLVDLLAGVGAQLVGRLHQRDDGQGEVIAVCFDEVMAGDGSGIYVVFPERSYGGLESKDRDVRCDKIR